MEIPGRQRDRQRREPPDRWWVIRVTQPLATVAFMGGAWLAGRSFPGEFDWHRVVVSALQSPRDNPLGYHWFAVGLALSALLLLPLRGYLARALAPHAPRGARIVRRLLSAGIIGMLLVAAFTHRPALYPRLHENLALLTYLTLVLALLAATFLFMRHPEATRLATRRSWSLPLLALGLFAPLIAAATTQLFVYLFPAVHPEASAAFPPWLSLAFWEWIVSAFLYGSAWVLAWLARPPERAKEEA